MKWCPRVVYVNGGTQTIDFLFPQKPWIPHSKPVGGSKISGSGVVAAYVVRRDNLCEVTLRFFESEWPALAAWLEWAQGGGTFDFYFDGGTPTTKYTVYLHDPTPGDGDIKPERESYPGLMSIRLVLRNSVNARFITAAY